MNDDALVRQLQSLEEQSGPFLSLYLNTEANRELGPQELDKRWRRQRESAAAQKVPDKALLLLDDAVEGSHREGDGLVAITAGEELTFHRYLDSSVRDSITVGGLPHLLPLFDHRQHHPAYAVVLIDRTGAEIHVVGVQREERVVEVEGDHDELRKVNPGGWSQRRFQNRAEDSWERNTEEVAERLTRIVRAEGLQLAIVMGDVRAKAFLIENAPGELRPVLAEVDTAPPTNDRLEEVREDVEAKVAALIGGTVEATLEKFLEERGQKDLAADGIEATLAALRMGQVETLLIASEGVEGTAWFATGDPTQGAVDRSTLQELGIGGLEEARCDDVLTRLALGTGAAICVIPALGPERGPRQGVGAILRFTT